MLDYLMGLKINGGIAIGLYWIPMLFCCVFYTVRTAVNYQKDKALLDDYLNNRRGHYSPTDTIGTLIGRVIVSVLPIANIWAAMFDLAPNVFGRLFSTIGRIFDQPLVPEKKRGDEKPKLSSF